MCSIIGCDTAWKRLCSAITVFRYAYQQVNWVVLLDSLAWGERLFSAERCYLSNKCLSELFLYLFCHILTTFYKWATAGMYFVDRLMRYWFAIFYFFFSSEGQKIIIISLLNLWNPLQGTSHYGCMILQFCWCVSHQKASCNKCSESVSFINFVSWHSHLMPLRDGETRHNCRLCQQHANTQMISTPMKFKVFVQIFPRQHTKFL